MKNLEELARTKPNILLGPSQKRLEYSNPMVDQAQIDPRARAGNSPYNLHHHTKSLRAAIRRLPMAVF
jgi:hypothetical protein